MNCKLGDIAVIVNGCHQGHLVSVIEQSEAFGPGWWWVETLGAPVTGHINFGDIRILIPACKDGNIEDSRLKPIRDPGDDAVDETLVPGYVRDEVTA